MDTALLSQEAPTTRTTLPDRKLLFVMVLR